MPAIPALVWGPLGGSEKVPPACRRYLGPRGRVTESWRPIATGWLRAWREPRSPAAGSTSWVRRTKTRRDAFAGCTRPVVVSPNVFLDPSWSRSSGRQRHAPRWSAPPRRLIGRLVAWKGIHLALQAMRHEQLADWDLHIYGRGPERRRVGAEIRRWGLEDRVFLTSRCPDPRSRRSMQEECPPVPACADAVLGGWRAPP